MGKADRRPSTKRRSPSARRMLFEALDPREMLAVLTVVSSNPQPGQFTSIQAAVNNAAPGDTIKLGATPVQGGFAESVNLSLMGSARPGGAQTGDLTIVGDSASAGTSILPPANAGGMSGTALYNSAPFTGNLVIDRVMLRPAIATPGEDKGIKLVNVTGNITITNVQIFDAVDMGIEIAYSGGAGASQSRITLDEIGINSNGVAPTGEGIRIVDVRALVSLDHVTVTDAGVGINIATTGATATSVTLRDVDVDVWSDELRGDDGVRISALGTSRLNVAFSFCDFLDAPSNSIDASVGDTANLAVNVYENSRFGNTDVSLVRTPGEAVAKFVSRGSGRMSVGIDRNIFDGLSGDAIFIQALDNSVMNANINQNFMASMGTETGHRNIVVLGNASANATVNARIVGNEIFDPSGPGIAVIGNGVSTYNVGIHDNNITYGQTTTVATAGIDIQGVSGQTAKMNIASVGNIIDGIANSIRVNQVSSIVQLKYEFALSQTVGSLQSYLEKNNQINRAVVQVFGELNSVRTAPGTFTPFMPLRLGDLIWADTNKNGLQDTGELPVGGVIVSLTGTETASGRAVDHTILSDGDHGYLFGALLPGTYTVTLVPPAGLDLTSLGRNTPSTTDNNEEFDSDFRQGIRQATVTLLSGVENMDLDAGLIPTNGRVWMNQINQFDVNDDGFITPLDALLVIIEINTGGSRTLGAPTLAKSPAPFVDVNGDGSLAPLDALQVIIRLNSGGGGAAQGEAADEQAQGYFPPEYFSTSSATSKSNTDDDTDSLDAFYALLAE